MVCQECEGQEDVFEDFSGEDPYDSWNEGDEGDLEEEVFPPGTSTRTTRATSK